MNDLKKKILAEIGELLSSLGFSKKAVGQSFIKNFEDGRQSVHLSFIEHKNDFDVTADIAIRFESIENLMNEDNKLLSKKEKKSTYTMGVELGTLIEGSPKRWTITEETNIEYIANEIYCYIKQYAIPYFTKYTEMKSAFELLSSNDQNVWIHCPIHGVRAKKVLCMAKIIGFETLIPELMKESLAFLKQTEDFGLNDYVQFSKKFE